MPRKPTDLSQARLIKERGLARIRLAQAQQLERLKLKAPARAEDTARERGRLEGKRKRILEQREDDLITREECNQRVAALDKELAALRSQTPAEHPEIDIVKLAMALQAYFAGFQAWPIEKQRRLLQWAIGDIVFNRTGIDTVSFKGGFLVRPHRWRSASAMSSIKPTGATTLESNWAHTVSGGASLAFRGARPGRAPGVLLVGFDLGRCGHS